MRRRIVVFALSVSLLLVSAGQPLAQSSASYSMLRASVDGGAARSTSASYLLHGSIGQADAALANSASYSVSGGFHKRSIAAIQPDAVFANSFE